MSISRWYLCVHSIDMTMIELLITTRILPSEIVKIIVPWQVHMASQMLNKGEKLSLSLINLVFREKLCFSSEKLRL